MVWGERKILVFTNTDCWKMYFSKPVKYSMTSNSKTNSPLTFVSLSHESQKQTFWKVFSEKQAFQENHMPGFEKVFETLV